MRRLSLVLPAILALGACAADAPAPSARLPVGVVEGGSDPMRYAVLQSAYVFNAPGAISPAKKAEAAALLEFVATNWGQDIRWNTPSPGLTAQLAAARDELRDALGIAPAARPQAVVSGLINAARRLEGDATGPGLPVDAFPDSRRTLSRLEALPALPATQRATQLMEQEFMRQEQERIHQSIGGGDAGRS
ncbi:MAG: hypothetical protein MUC64_07345 [Rubritepida sp.]|jgi:hypothetical protein|nr:hypothetical protein [Rubritepida sp.]